MSDTPPIAAAPAAVASPAMQSGKQQAEVATLIIVAMTILGGIGIVASLWASLALIGIVGKAVTPAQAAMVAIGGVVTAGFSLATGCVGALATALNAPSGIGSVLSAAKRADTQ